MVPVLSQVVAGGGKRKRAWRLPLPRGMIPPLGLELGEGEAQERLGLEFRDLPPIPKGQKAEGELFVTSLSVMARIIASLKIIFQGVNFLGIE